VPRGDGDAGRPALALAVGLACWGVDAFRARFRSWSESADIGAPPPAGLVSFAPLRLRPRALLVGLVVVGPPRAAAALRRARSAAEPAIRLAVLCARPAARLPGVRGAVVAGRRLRARAVSALTELAITGEREAARCERFAQVATQEVFDGTLSAFGQAAELREVLVEQSAGIAEETLAEVRQRSEQADARMQALAHSLLPRRLWARLAARVRGSGPLGPLPPEPASGRSG
jgi:hypothetical protein